MGHTINQNRKIGFVKEKINALLEEKSFVLIAIEGRSGAGKTTFAEELAEEYSCLILHMDDFFLRPEQRTKARLETPGGNVDYERFLEEVMIPLQTQMEFSYCAFDCRRQKLKEPVRVKRTPVVIVEGSYSCHPVLWDNYDYRVFLDVDKEEQKKRIIRRNGEQQAVDFFEKWIPLEEKYFQHFRIMERCDLILK